MRDRLLALMPEFAMIGAADLREKALQTWELALAESTWTLEELVHMPFTLLINPCPVNFIEHVRAVTLTAIRAAEAFSEVYGDLMPVNLDILITGALLHDVGKLAEYEMRADGVTVQSSAGQLLRHPFSGTALAARCGLPLEVQHLIATHAGEGDKVERTVEATILNHADFMNFHSVQRLAHKSPLSRSPLPQRP